MDEQRQILKSAGGIGSATLASRILGYLRDMLIASHFGTGIFASAFFAAFRIPNLFRRLLGEGALSASFIPVFTDYLTKRGKEEAWHLAMAIFNLLLVILAGITLLGILASPFISKLIVPGFSPGKVELTAKLLRILFPYLFFIG
ncbi:murein biosynthesis integral membrane protein MurJ, partial [bacterium]|nr:murein biosynthesis integral membrane protein MurJ [bacterium]